MNSIKGTIGAIVSKEQSFTYRVTLIVSFYSEVGLLIQTKNEELAIRADDDCLSMPPDKERPLIFTGDSVVSEDESKYSIPLHCVGIMAGIV